MGIKISFNAQRFFEAMSIVSETKINHEAIQHVINTLMKWRDPKDADLRWSYDFQYFIDEDGRQYGDHIAVFLWRIKGMRAVLQSYAKEHGEKAMIIAFSDYTGMPFDHVVALGTLGGYPIYEDEPAYDMISPRDVARTLHNYLFDGGKCMPDWSWYPHASMDDNAPTLEEFMKK